MVLTFLRCQFTIFSKLQGKVGRVSFFFEVLPLLEVVLELLLFCLDCEELLLDLESDLEELDLGLGLQMEAQEVGFFMGCFCSAFPVTGIDGLGKDEETREGVWLVVVNCV